MVIPSFYPIVGGAEKQLLGLSMKMIEIGQQLDILTRYQHRNPRHEVINGCNVHRIGSSSRTISFLISLILFILKNRKSYSIIHIHTLNSPAIILVTLGKILGIKTIVKVTRSGKKTQLSRYRDSALGKCLFILLRKYTSRFIAITKDVHTELSLMGVSSKKIAQIPNGVSLPVNSKKPYEVDQEINLVFIGRLIKRKRVDLLIEVFADIYLNKDINLFIAGTGPEEELLRDIAESAEIQNQATFMGEIKSQEVSKLLESTHIFILPSESEGMSNALLEAMSYSNVVIARNIEANQEIISDEMNGFLFENKDDLKDILLKLINSESLFNKVSVRGYQTIEESFSFEKVSKQYIDLYKEILN